MTNNPKLILASASPRRVELLGLIGITADEILPSDIDETQHKDEMPLAYAKRMAQEKAQCAAQKRPGCFILAADTVVVCGRRILQKPENEDEARRFLTRISGRRHTVLGGICVIAPHGKDVLRLSKTTVKFKKLTEAEISEYLSSGEWQGKAGGYAVQGRAAKFISFIQGSHSNIVGLSLYDANAMLQGLGWKS